MSGGYFNYDQYRIQYIADAIEQLILDNDSTEVDQYGFSKGNGYSADTIEEFRVSLLHLKKAIIYAQRIDWLVSGDDGEESFHERLKSDMEKEGFW